MSTYIPSYRPSTATGTRTAEQEALSAALVLWESAEANGLDPRQVMAKLLGDPPADRPPRAVIRQHRPNCRCPCHEIDYFLLSHAERRNCEARQCPDERNEP